MVLYMKQAVFTFGDRFAIYDEAGNDCFYVEGEFFSWGKKLHLYDRNGAELAYVEEKLFRFRRCYEIYRGNAFCTEVIREFSFLSLRYSVPSYGWQVEGDFLAHDYAIVSETEAIATISKEWFTLGDAYRIEIGRADPITVLAIVLILDACTEKNH
ncbi:MAG: hypothetical protein E7618_00730 [Ruminococcaceae bacterium]|nr:hypothetical protein [Oscillospiraceae bacterium]